MHNVFTRGDIKDDKIQIKETKTFVNKVNTFSSNFGVKRVMLKYGDGIIGWHQNGWRRIGCRQNGWRRNGGAETDGAETAGAETAAPKRLAPNRRRRIGWRRNGGAESAAA